MMRVLRGILWTALFCGQTLTAQITLREAVEIGLRPGHRLDVDLSRLAEERAGSQARGAKANLLPSVDGRASGGGRSFNLQSIGFAGGGSGQPANLTPSFSTFDTRALASATLLNFAQWKQWKAAQLDAKRAATDSDWSRDAAARQIAEQYLATLQAQAEIEVAENDLRLSEEMLSAARERNAAGTVTKVEVTRARSQLAASRGAHIGRRQAFQEQLASLARLIGAEVPPDARLVPLNLPGEEQPNETDAIRLAEESRADLRAANQNVESARVRVSATRWEGAPSLTASADYGPNGLSPANSALTHTLSLSLTIPVFDSGRRKERVAQTEIQVREAQSRAADLRRQIRRDVRVALSRIASAQGQREAANAEHDFALQQLEQIRERVAAGLGTGLDLSDAQARLLRSRLSQTQSEYAHHLAVVQLQAAVGKIDAWILRQ